MWYSSLMIDPRDGNGVGQVRRMGSLPLSRMVLSYPIPALPRMTETIFLPHTRLLGPRAHLVKLYFLLICPQLLQLFSIKLFH